MDSIRKQIEQVMLATALAPAFRFRLCLSSRPSFPEWFLVTVFPHRNEILKTGGDGCDRSCQELLSLPLPIFMGMG